MPIISLVAIFLVLVLPAAPAHAGGPRPGCYLRDYSRSHLARHPDQIVDRITLSVRRDAHGETVAAMRVLTANQGHVARSGQGRQVFDQFLLCWNDGVRTGCSVECDGGHFVVTRDTGKVLTFRTRGLWVGETGDCGGAIDLAEHPGRAVSYRLDRVSDAVCSGL